MMNSSVDIASAMTFCGVELVPFELALYRQHRSENLDQEWHAPWMNGWSLGKFNGAVVP